MTGRNFHFRLQLGCSSPASGGSRSGIPFDRFAFTHSKNVLSTNMFAGLLFLMMSVTFAVPSDSSSLTEPIFQAHANFANSLTENTDIQPYESNAARQGTLGNPLRKERNRTLRPALFSIVAVLAVAFIVLQCFKALASAASPTSTTRRLSSSDGGLDLCDVSGGFCITSAGAS